MLDQNRNSGQGWWFVPLLALGMGCVVSEEGAGEPGSTWHYSAPAAPPPRPRAVEEEESLAPDATLDEYRLHAAAHNPGLEALFHGWRSAMERVPQARALPAPRFTYTEFLREVETRVGPQERSYALTQTFPWFGTLRLRGSIEEEAARVAWQRLIAAQTDLDHRVRGAYADYYYLGKSIAITGENLELLSRLESVARRQLATGATDYSNVVRLQVEMGRLEDRERTLLDQRGPLASRLNALLDRPLEAEIPWPETLAETAIPLDEIEILTELPRPLHRGQENTHTLCQAGWQVDAENADYLSPNGQQA